MELPGRLLNESWLIREGSPLALLLFLSPSFLSSPTPFFLFIYLPFSESLRSHFGPWGALDDESHVLGCRSRRTKVMHSMLTIPTLLHAWPLDFRAWESQTDAPRQRLANLFSEGPDSKCFRLHRPDSLCHNSLTLLLECKGGHRQLISRWVAVFK